MNRESSQPIRPETLLTSYQVGSLLQVNPSSVNKWVKDGRIPAFRTPGGHRRIRASDLVVFLKKHEMPVPPTLAQAARRRLLIVDDDQRELDSMQRMLKPHAELIDLKLIDNGVDALITVGSFKPNVVVLDAIMPQMDGLEVCRRLRANPETHNIRVVIMSAEFSREMEEKAAEAGAIKCLAKPLDVGLLVDTLGVGVVSTASPADP